MDHIVYVAKEPDTRPLMVRGINSVLKYEPLLSLVALSVLAYHRPLSGPLTLGEKVLYIVWGAEVFEGLVRGCRAQPHLFSQYI